MKMTADDRDWFITGHGLDGRLLEDEVRESLRFDLLASQAHSEAEIRAFIQGWLMRLASEARTVSA